MTIKKVKSLHCGWYTILLKFLKFKFNNTIKQVVLIKAQKVFLIFFFFNNVLFENFIKPKVVDYTTKAKQFKNINFPLIKSDLNYNVSY